jgi:hypothetical protein
LTLQSFEDIKPDKGYIKVLRSPPPLG